MFSWAQKCGLPTYTTRWFLQARDEALKSDFHRAKIGCVIVYKNEAVGRGHNQLKTDPYQKKYNQKYRLWTNEPGFSNTCGHTLHAEIDAIKNIPYAVSSKFSKNRLDAYIYRIGLGLEGYSGLALPCEACAHALQDLGVHKIYYTTGNIHNPLGCCDL